MSLKDEEQKIVDFVRNGDAKADSLLDKLKSSKWTGAILLGVVLVVLWSLF